MNPIHIQTTIPGPKSTQMIQRANNAIASTQYIGCFGITLSSGKGNYITDVDGNTYLDFLSGASVVTLGYGREDLIQTYADAARKLQHSCYPYSPNEESIHFAESLIKVTPGAFDKRVLFGLSGSDSIDAAIKIARKYTGRKNIISFNNGYHGSTGLSLAANGFEVFHAGLFLDDGFDKVDFPATNEEAERTLSAIENLLKKGNVAALITETVQGDGGNIVPPQGFHKSLADLLHQYQAVYVVDEVQSGSGRSGKWWECEHFDIIPDILCTAKGITSGYAPLSACVARREMAETLTKAQHLFTFSGHLPSCAVAEKVFSILSKEKLLENAAIRGKQLKQGLEKLVGVYPCAKEVRGLGLHMGFEVIDTRDQTPLGGLFAFRCVEKGLYPGYFGPTNNVMRLHPPLTINQEEVQYAVDVISAVVEEWETRRFPQETIQRYRQFSVGLGTD